MAGILDTIVAHKRSELNRRRRERSLASLRDSPFFDRARASLSDRLRRSKGYGIIAEFKRKSPSQADINLHADPVGVAEGYRHAGAAAMSVLTDQAFFGAQADDFSLVRQTVELPLLRKDFMIDPYQMAEARSMGADAVLLIAACLSKDQLHELAEAARQYGLEVVCELHHQEEIAKLSPLVDIVGINNRNLATFEVDIDQSLQLAEQLPAALRISESGIEDPQSIARLRQAGFEGYLIGTHFMRTADPGRACARFIAELQPPAPIPSS